MKLMYRLPEAEEAAYQAIASPDEKRMYCLPYDIEGTAFVSGFMLFTDQKIYKLCDGKLVDSWDISTLSDFATDIMYGSVSFYAKRDGASVILCRFISGRNLPRYAVVVSGCELLAKRAREKDTSNIEPLTSSEPERYCPKCGRPFLLHTQICPACQSKREIYKKLWAMTHGLRLMMCFPLFAAVLSVIFRFVVPAIQKIAINDFITNNNIDVKGDGVMLHFGIIVVALVMLDLCHRAIAVFQGRISAISGNRFTRMLRTLLFEKVQTLSMNSIQTKTTGDLMSRINNDVTVVQSFVTGQLPTLFGQLFSFVLALVLLLWLNPLMCLFVFIPLPLAIWFISKFWSTMRNRNVRAWLIGVRVSRYLQDVLNGMRVVKSYGNEKRTVKTFEALSADSSAQDESNAKLYDTVFPILAFFVRLGSYAILLYGNLMLFGGSMDVGTLNQFNSYANIIYEPLMSITTIPRSISNFLTSLSKIFEILEETPEVADIDLPIDIRIEGNVEVKNITFGYDSFNPVLKNVNLSVKQGEMVGIVGHSGCGKTTLINLIMRLYDVSEGAIEIDNVDIRHISQGALRTQIGVVLQETHLFSGSIRDNIRYSKPHATNEEVIAAARAANAHDFIVSLPEGYNTIVGEKGFSLSGGERQRIAIARALIHDPRILILDEATAALDTETEKLIQDAINNLTVGRTTFAIAHRLSTLRNADKLLVLDHGTVVEFGTHAELLAQKGYYYKLVMAQQRAALRDAK